MMNWYGVKVLYCARITGEPAGDRLDAHYHGDDFYEESLLLVQAETPQRAADWAAEHCRKGDRSYTNRYGQQVDYKFYDWLEVEQIPTATLRCGTPVMSTVYRMARGADAEELIAQRFSPCDGGQMFPLHALEGEE